jgi:hypothetical protein
MAYIKVILVKRTKADIQQPLARQTELQNRPNHGPDCNFQSILFFSFFQRWSSQLHLERIKRQQVYLTFT